jgi:hypothetical protein
MRQDQGEGDHRSRPKPPGSKAIEYVTEMKADFQPIDALTGMLDEMIEWIQEVQIQAQSSQRFGNLAFRTYMKLVDEVNLLL